MGSTNISEWFKSASTPVTDIAHMLMELDEKGHIPESMRRAIYKHADNSLETLPRTIGAISDAIANGLSDGSIAGSDAANVVWGISTLSDKMAGMKELAFQFGPETDYRGVPRPIISPAKSA